MGHAAAQEPLPQPLPVAVPVDPGKERDGDPLRAQRLFDEALALRDQGRWQDSCARFRESMAVDPAVGTLLNVAGCSAKEGKLAQAIKEYQRLEEINARTRDPDRQRNVREQASAALKDLLRRVPRIVLKITPRSPAARVVLDGRDAEVVRAGEPLLVDVGAHVIEVEADGYARARASVSVKEGEQLTVPIELKSGVASAAGSPGLRIAGWIVSAIGAGALASGGMLFVLAADRAGQVRDVCGPDAAPPSCPRGSAERANEISDEGEMFSSASYALLAVGGAALVTGVALVIVDTTGQATGKGEGAGVRASVNATAGPGQVGLWIGGAF